MSVFVMIMYSTWGSDDIVGIYSTLQNAEAAWDKLHASAQKKTRIHEFRLDPDENSTGEVVMEEKGEDL